GGPGRIPGKMHLGRWRPSRASGGALGEGGDRVAEPQGPRLGVGSGCDRVGRPIGRDSTAGHGPFASRAKPRPGPSTRPLWPHPDSTRTRPPMPPPDVVPEILLTRARAGDAAALGQLLELYRNYLRLIARSVMGHAPGLKLDASDL